MHLGGGGGKKVRGAQTLMVISSSKCADNLHVCHGLADLAGSGTAIALYSLIFISKQLWVILVIILSVCLGVIVIVIVGKTSQSNLLYYNLLLG